MLDLFPEQAETFFPARAILLSDGIDPMMGFREEPREDAQRRTPAHSFRDDIDYDHRHFVNLCATAALLTLALGFGWTVKIFDQQQRMERCLMSGRKDCVEIGRVSRGMVQLPPIVSR